MRKRRVVITGVGAITALGEGAQALWNAALEGRSGVDFLAWGANLPHETRPIGAAIRGFDAEKFVKQRKSLKVMARDIQLAVGAASLAIADAFAVPAEGPRDRFGVVVGSGVLNHELDELCYSVQHSLDEHGRLDLKRFGDEGMASLFPLWLLKYLPNMPACHISILFDLQGPNNTITTGVSSGLQAVGEAFHIIERGAADWMLAGGAESKINPVGMSEYQLLGVLPVLNGDAPAKIYRPFDTNAQGLVVGEGAGFLVLEEKEHAQKRGARIYAEILGFGCSSLTGQSVAMRSALEEAGLEAGKVGYLQACGLGVRSEDELEAGAIEAVFKDQGRNLLVSASKATTGFTGFAAGALDLILASFSLSEGRVPPALNFQKPARDWKFNVAKQTLRSDARVAMVNAFGLGSQSASIVIGKTETP